MVWFRRPLGIRAPVPLSAIEAATMIAAKRRVRVFFVALIRLFIPPDLDPV
jgi:hypothetical protein